MTKPAKPTVKAAKSQIKRDGRNVETPTPERSQGALYDRHIRNHTPDRLYPSNDSGQE